MADIFLEIYTAVLTKEPRRRDTQMGEVGTRPEERGRHHQAAASLVDQPRRPNGSLTLLHNEPLNTKPH